MKEKIQLLIKNEGLTQSRLAEILEIQPANISHILSGRSKPGFELLQKILRRFPRLSPDWLLLGQGEMYRAEGDQQLTASGAPLPSNERPVPNFDSLFASTETAQPSANQNKEQEAVLPLPRPLGTSAPVARVVVFYADHTFESFEPKA